ncbi:low-density lipoprotein receptor-related protein 4-like isoform X2 [Daktulosphaira vitifoliae]|uniref:low-density lipoprotein receptor-related protein 4-like isoform X2 n=1 Tax=Daktulosphaira vitifoliae TaxID=58002 RepID=UPI0021AAA54E|nr:low-density lipoprotein receptor-related protein 4-like isoform X2 [Daktulosphaira vitifoliae]
MQILVLFLQQMNESSLLFTMIGSCVSIDYHINGDLVITANPLVNSIKQINQSILDVLCCKSNNAAIDWLHGLIFFSLQNSFKIEVISLNGKFRHSLTDKKIHQPRDITAIPTKRMIIWIDYEENPVLQIMDMDGTNRRILVKDNIITPSGIAVDLSSDTVYWADISLRAIFCISLNGNNRRTVIKRKLSDPSGLAIVDQHLYWVDWYTKSIQSANKETGEDLKIIRKGLGSAIKIKRQSPIFNRLHQSFVPEIINSCGVNNGNCSHICLPMNTSFICKCPYDLKLANDSRTCETTNEIFILMNGVDRLQIIKLNNLTYTHDEIIQLNLSQSTSKVDWDNGFIFWSDPCKQVISKIETISSKINIIINHRVVSPSGLAVDWITKKLYFTDSVENTIEVTDYEGQNRTIVIWEKLESPRSLVLDPSTRYMYWISTHEAKPKIEMAGMDGCCRNTFFEGNLKNPVSLTIDMFTRTLYWVDVEKRTIESFPLDKKNKNENSTIILQFNSTMSPHGLAVNKYYLYWTDTNTNTMYKMNKTQNSQVTIDVIRQNITGFKDIQIFNDRQYIAHSFCHFNNGGCSHICLSSPLRNRRSCACPIGYTLEPQNKKKCVIFPSKFILMAHSSKIHMLSFDTPYFKDTILPIKNLKSVSLIGMDNIKGDVYWIDSVTSAIFKVNVQNFSNTELVLSNNIYQPESLAIDPMGRRSSLASIYWSDYNRGTIEVVDSDGRNRLILVTNIIGNVRSLAVYPDFSFLYWCTYSKVGKIERVDFDGSNRTLIRSSEKLASWPIGFSIDKKNNRLYWTDNYFDTLQSTKLDGSDWMTEVTGNKYPFGVPFKENMSFWFDINTNQLVKSNQIQSKYVQSTINYLYWVFDIKYYELYKTNPDIVNVCDIDNGGCSHICMRNSRGFKCTCPIGMSLNPHTILCEVETGDQILYAAKSEIGLILLDGSNSLLTQTLNISGAKNLINLDFHWNQKLIYYNDIELKQIRSVSMIEPHNEKAIINEHIRTLNNIAVDWIANNLYFTDSIEGIIEVSKLDGSCRRIIIHEPNEEPWSIAVHPTLGYIFWSDWGTVPKIVKSLTDGSHREVVLQSFINFANSLTIDYVANLIYWTDGVTNNLERCDFEGKNREILIYNNVRPFGIGLLDNSIFFFNWFTLQLEQRDLDAYSFEARMDTNKKEPIDIKVISSSRQRGWNPCAVNNGYCTHLCLYLGRDKHYICECPDKTDGRDCSLKPLKVVEDINDNEDQYQNCLSLLKFIWKAMMFKYTLLSFGVLLIVLGWMFTKQFWINVINFYYEEDMNEVAL